jgi:Zn-dependent protease with chaperone function
MSLIFENQSYPSLQEFVKKEKNNTGSLYGKRLEFAHEIDGKVISILESTKVKTAINKVVDVFVSQQSGILLSTGIVVDPFNYPVVYKNLLQCCKTLGISIPHTVISSSMPGINAMATGSEEAPFLAVSDLAHRLLTPDELRFILGHECGHLAMEHVVYHTIGNYIGNLGAFLPVIGPIIANIITFPINAWSRYSEITADRAGLLCCGDLLVAKKALLKLVGGFSDTSNVDLDTYVEQSLNSLSQMKIGALNELFMSHPLVPKRLKALDLFVNSQLYYRITNKEIPMGCNLLSNDALKAKTNELLTILK